MTKEPNFPPDDFDHAATLDGPSGVHRAPVSAWSKLWPWLAVIVCFSLLGVLVANLAAQVTDPADWPTIIQNESTDPAPDPDGEGGNDGVEDPADPGNETTDTGTELSPDPEETQDTEPTIEPEPELEPDFGTEVEVLNAAGISGLAGYAADQLTDVGFTTVAAGNHQGPAVSADTVFYGTEDLAVTAKLVADTLGLGAPQLAADRAPLGIVIVLVSDIR